MRLPDKSRLKSTLKKLRAIRCEVVEPEDVRTAAQEALDFVAMLAGLKQVYVLGRGFSDPAWCDGVLELSDAMDLSVFEGPYWIAPDAFEGLPDWFIEGTLADQEFLTAHYICRARGVAEEVERIAETGDIAVAQEARLLGFPPCCVADHYARARIIHGIRYTLLRRASGGDVARMRDLLDSFAPPEDMTDDERSALRDAFSVIPCPFTSLNLCRSCAEDRDGPGARLSRRYAELAMTLDPTLYDVLMERA